MPIFGIKVELANRTWRSFDSHNRVYSPEPCAEVYCVRLNFNTCISKLVYYFRCFCCRVVLTTKEFIV